MVSTDDLHKKSCMGFSQNPLLKMAEIRHLENRHIATENHQILMKFGIHMQIWNSVTVT